MNTPADSGSQGTWSYKWGWVVVVVIGTVLFVRSLSPDLTTARGDVSVIGIKIAQASLPYGVFARWEPGEGMGMPNVGHPLTPSTLLLAMVSYRKYVDLNYMLFTLLLGVGGWLLLRDITRSHVAALVGGIWFMLQPHAFTHMLPGHLGYFWMCAWIPYCILFLRKGVATGRVAWWILAGAASGQALCGTADMGLIFMFFIAGYGLFLVAEKWYERRRAGAGGVRYVAGAAIGGFLAGLACLLMGYQILVGTANLVAGMEHPVSASKVENGSSPEKEREKYLWATQWSIPPEEALDFVIPGLFGWGSSCRDNPYRGRVGQTEGFFERGGLPNLNDINNYVGALMALGCVVAVVARRKSREAWFFVAAGVAACLLSFGKHAPLYRLFYELPYMSSIRNPIKWFEVTSFCVGILGSIGLAEAVSRESALARLSSARRAILCFAPGVVVVVAGIVFIASIGSGQKWAFWQGTSVVDMAKGAVVAAGFFWALAGGLFFWALSDRAKSIGSGSRRSAVDIAFPAAAAILVLIEILYVDLHFMPYEPMPEVRSDPMVEYVNAQKKPFRILLMRMDGVYRYISDIFCPAFGWERPSVSVSRTEDASTIFMRTLGDPKTGDPKKMLQLANVHYLFSPSRIGDPDFLPVASVQYGNTPVIVHRFTNALPRYYIVGRWEVVPEDEALATMASREFDPRQSVLLHVKPEEAPAQPTEAVTATCEVTDYSHKGATVVSRSSSPAIMVSLERHSRLWAVFVDGKEVPMFKANWMLRACQVPAGEHTVEWRLVGDGGWGFWFGVAGWAVVAVAVLWLAVGRRLAARKA